MTVCEECWANAYTLSRVLGGSQVDRYHEELLKHPEHDANNEGDNND